MKCTFEHSFKVAPREGDPNVATFLAMTSKITKKIKIVLTKEFNLTVERCENGDVAVIVEEAEDK